MTTPATRGETKRGIWAIADQGVVSLGNFFTTILMARALPATEYGVFALVFGALLVLNTVHGAWVVYPLAISAAPVGPERTKRLVTAALAVSLCTSLTLGAVGAIVAFFTGQIVIVLPALAALVAWQFQETTRTGLVAHLRYSDALIGDALSYLGQAICIWILGQAHNSGVKACLLVTCATSALGAAVQLYQLDAPVRLRERALRLLARRAWRDGRWLLGNRILNVWTAQGFGWALAYRFGTASVGNFQALMNILAFSHPILFGLGNAMMSAVARCSTGSRARLAHAVTPFCGLLTILLVPYFTIVLIRPELAVFLYYGETSPHMGRAYLLRILVVAYIFLLVIVVPSAILSGISRAASLFGPQCAAAVATLLWGIPMTLHFGLLGAALGLAGVNIVHGTACTAALLSALRPQPRREAITAL